ncbi:hypothetical protein [Paenibacillus sp. L3-i20]|uniref:hypothetical protein n=1 Tax=Paenibacillus sp. L3-i20 TaxID=2905833 RepID=UPI001EDDB92B|nr:hypothetical protein [Paenibacillus sp. L3-i20]GKU78950.1 hypothetical protein L3i20_v233470 [Paenibacillus sp. L3-i20]
MSTSSEMNTLFSGCKVKQKNFTDDGVRFLKKELSQKYKYLLHETARMMKNGRK